MKTLYLDIFSGISGDMLLGALIDLGVDLRRLENELAKLDLAGYHVHASRRQKTNIEGVKFEVHLARGHEHAEAHDHEPDHDSHHHSHDHRHPHGHDHDHEHARHHGHSHDHDHDEAHDAHLHDPHDHDHEDHAPHSRDFAAIRNLISQSRLSDWVKQKSLAVFQRIAVAEGKIHGQPPDKVHFHEVGAIDSIVDIVGACAALELLDKPRVLAAPAVEGTGWVNCAHGRFPVPTMATLEILGTRGVALSQCEEPHELITPTGAALLAEFAERFGPMEGLVADKVGYGLGTRDHQTRPNVLRAILGEAKASKSPGFSLNDWETDTIAVLESNLDDCHAEVLGHFLEQALAAGALDVFYVPIQMKKNRPGVLLTVLCEVGSADQFTELVLRETSAFGVRRSLVERRKLRRELKVIQTPYGEVTVKLGNLNGQVVHTTPEFESCRNLAAKARVPLKQVYEAVARSMNL